MPAIQLSTFIAAPIERVFDLSRSIDLHVASAGKTGERAVGGVTSGLIGLNQEVTWRAKHFGMWQELTARITICDRPVHFADVMQQGAFSRMEHHHYFEPAPGGTTMRDEFVFESPTGILGRIASALPVEKHLREFLIERNQAIKSTAESEAWRKYLPGAES